MNFYEELVEYFENTPRHKVLEDWAKSEKWNNVGPTIDELLNNNKKYNKMKRQELVLAGLAKEDNKLTIERAIAKEKKSFEKTLRDKKDLLEDLEEELKDRLNSNITLDYAIIESSLLNISKMKTSTQLMEKFITDYYGN